MKEILLEWLRCPAPIKSGKKATCQGKFGIQIHRKDHYEIADGMLTCKCCGQQFPITNFIPRFVVADEYAKNFSFEWNLHRQTQLDSKKSHLSQDTFIEKTGFCLDDLQGKLVLDVGVGMGRFADVVERHGATVIGMDLSYSVDAAQKNIGDRPGVHLIQANVFNIPFEIETFDYIYSIGVLHHTPNCEAAFKKLPLLLKSGGWIAIWVYSGYTLGEPINKAWRRITTRLPQKLLYALCCIIAPFTYLFNTTVLQMRFWHYLLPGFVYHLFPRFPSYRSIKWRVLDAFDWYSPKYQSKHTYPEVYRWFREEGLIDIEIKVPEVTISGRKK